MVLRDFEKRLTEMEEQKTIKKLVGTTSTSNPVVNSVKLTNSSKYRLGLGAYIDVMVTLSEPVIVKKEGGKPTLKIQFVPGVTRDAKYESGSGTTELIFRYTIGENPNDSSQGISVPAGSICVPHKSAIENARGRSVRLRHPAAAAPKPPLEVTNEFDEVRVNQSVNTLCRSHLPTLVVEGEHDSLIYEEIEYLLGTPYIKSLPVGGRDNLLEIYERRKEFSSQVPVAFMADPDMWVLEDPHNMLKRYVDIIWTTGYSLENDLYADGNPISLIHPADLSDHNDALDCAIRRFVAKKAPPGRQREYYAVISANTALKLRGKDLLKVLMRFCSPKPHLHVCKRIIGTVRNHHPLLTRLILAIRTEIEKRSKGIKKSLLLGSSSGSGTTIAPRVPKKYP